MPRPMIVPCKGSRDAAFSEEAILLAVPRSPFAGPSFGQMQRERVHILITGASGQLGGAFARHAAAFPGLELRLVNHQEFDITLRSRVERGLEEWRPDAVVNCAAYTNVENAELDRDQAFLVNARAPGYLAKACDAVDALLMHFSTDYVFDGFRQTAYSESDEPAPLSVYGESKLEGEHAIAADYGRHLIVRTSWLYDYLGHNFYRTMKRLAREQGFLRVVNDQVASPTWAGQLALDMLGWLEQILVHTRHTEYGIYHYSHSGVASWFDFASAIVDGLGLQVPVHPVSTGEVSTRARRPAYSKLDPTRFLAASGAEDISWQRALEKCIKEDLQHGYHHIAHA